MHNKVIHVKLTYRQAMMVLYIDFTLVFFFGNIGLRANDEEIEANMTTIIATQVYHKSLVGFR